MKRAFIEANTVVDLVSVDPFAVYQAAYAERFIEVPEFVELGWQLDGETWAPPAAVEVPEPVPVRTVLTRLAMMSRFTDDELAAIYTAAKSDVGVEIWLDRFKMSEEIDPQDSRTQQGLQLLVERGLLTAERVVELLA